KEKIGEVVKALESYSVFAPVANGETVRFQKMDGKAQATIDYKNTNVPPKEIFFPQTETLFRYRAGSDELKPKVPDKDEKLLVFGIRPCDARAISIVEKLWQWDYADPYFKNRRESATLIGLACLEPCINCFCASVGGGPADEENLDGIMFDLGEVVLLKTITEKGEQVAEALGGILEKKEGKVAEAKRRASEAANKIKRSIDTEGISERLPSLYDHPFWEEYSLRCLGCGTCTYLCPTCHCFDIQDEIEGFDGRRARMWDTCMFAEYSLHASGHNPRPTRKERTRNRISHKYSYYPRKFGVIACVGCGRCTNNCPVNIDILDILYNAKNVPLKEAKEA
ncbi:MAG: 4Fe-4S dicluster domain-containing protein, partial [Actinomycetota bacterium]|nr:4Fe-4S dicluster domain-containing protein [Actinomycetota bacterium]